MSGERPTAGETIRWFARQRPQMKKMLVLTATFRVVFALFAFDKAIDVLRSLVEGSWWGAVSNAALFLFVVWVWPATRKAKDLLDGVVTAIAATDDWARRER